MPENLAQNVPVLILAGGASSRMRGIYKPLAPFAGKTLIEFIIQRVRQQTEHVIISENRLSEEIIRLGYPVLKDNWPDTRGPLAGIEAGLAWVKKLKPEVPGMVSIPCDTPFIPENLVSALCTQAGLAESSPEICSASSPNSQHLYQHHWAHAYWPVAILPFVRESLKNHQLSLAKLAHEYGFKTVSFERQELPEKSSLDPFTNINTPEELVLTEQLLSTF